jgi:proline racemase
MPVAQRIRFVDSHTGGEPTRLVMDGGPDLGDGPLEERVRIFRESFDRWRTAIVNEPRGCDTMVGALLVPPYRGDCRFGVVFFNNVGPLGMCGHGTMGVVASLAHLGMISAGIVRIDTAVGAVQAELHARGEISVVNVPSHRKARAVTLEVPGIGIIQGDVAWGGNWFFLVENHGLTLELARVSELTDAAWKIRQAVNAHGFPEVDHVELIAPARGGANARNFVLCPGKAYDRSPCGTGTSAKLACLAADGKLAEEADWIQESIIGSRFTAKYRWVNREKGEIEPTISGTAFVTAEGMQLLDSRDPLCWGIR